MASRHGDGDGPLLIAVVVWFVVAIRLASSYTYDPHTGWLKVGTFGVSFLVIVGPVILYKVIQGRRARLEWEAGEAGKRVEREAAARAQRDKDLAGWIARNVSETITNPVRDERSVPQTMAAPPASGMATQPVAISRWRQAEIFVARWMAAIGFDDVTATRANRDMGVDVVSRTAVAQVKFQAAPVGRPAVQQLFGEAQARGLQALFFSSSGYGKDATEWASGRVALFTFTATGVVQPANEAAVAVLLSTSRTDQPLETHEILAAAIRHQDPPRRSHATYGYRPTRTYRRRRYR